MVANWGDSRKLVSVSTTILISVLGLFLKTHVHPIYADTRVPGMHKTGDLLAPFEGLVLKAGVQVWRQS